MIHTIWQKQETNLIFPLQILLLLCLVLPFPAFAAEKGDALQVVEGGLFLETGSGRMWQMERSRKLRSVTEVQQYLIDLNTGKYSDWRLPTKQELYDLFSIFDLKRNGGVIVKLEGHYWLDDAGMNVGTWEIGDQCGPTRSFYPGKVGHVWAVRQ